MDAQKAFAEAAFYAPTNTKAKDALDPKVLDRIKREVISG